MEQNKNKIASTLKRLRQLRTEVNGAVDALMFLDLEKHPERLTDPKCDGKELVSFLSSASAEIENICRELAGEKADTIQIPLQNGRVLGASLCNYDGNHPEITITLNDPETGLIEQDICLVRVHEEEEKGSSKNESIDVLVWADKNDEDITNQFEIEQYFPGEEEDDDE